MKNFTLLLLFLATSFSMLHAQYSEDFEGGALPAGWSIETMATDGGFLFGDATTLSSGSYIITDHTLFAATNDDACDCDKLSERLISPDIDLTGLSAPILSYASLFYGGTYLGNTETASVEVSTDGGTTWTSIGDLPTGTDWVNSTVSLAAYSGVIKLAFHYSDGTGWLYGLAVDDVAVLGAPTVNVTFQVNMANETVSPLGVHIAGNFQGWSPASSTMTDVDGDGIYTYTAALNSGYNAEYKFINGNAWGSDESVPGACGVDNGQGGYNRAYTVGLGDATLDVVCYASCSNCSDGGSCESPQPAFEGTNTCAALAGVPSQGDAGLARWFAFTATQSGVVTVASCGGGIDTRLWIHVNDCADPAIITANDDYCELTTDADHYASQASFEVVSGQTYLIEWDDRWDATGFDFTITYGGELATVTYSVDMANEVVDPAGVYMINFGFPPANAVPMTNTSGSIWSVTLSNTLVGNTSYYLFINGDAATGTGESGLDCTSVFPGYNAPFRTVVPSSATTTLPTDCFNVCGPCAVVVPAITLVCDMQAFVDGGGTVSANGIHVAGDFQSEAGFPSDWDPTSAAMTNITGTEKWTITLNIPAGNYAYKFVNGNAWGDNENVTGDCGTGADGNRALTVAGDATIEFCYNYCVTCDMVGTTDPAFNAAIHMMPNPANDKVTVSYQFDENVDLNVRLMNQLGQEISAQQVSGQSGNLQLDLNTIPNGVYMVQFTDGVRYAAQRLVVQK